MSNDAEQGRLDEDRNRVALWRRWGPYLSARQWGTVREDYSPGGTAWDSFPHEHARSRAYRWGEDGLGGISDHWQHLCFSVALWNTTDAILKERLFGLTNSEGNHGEDVKEYWWALDSTPTHSYMRWLYKYPQRAFPYGDLVEGNRQRGREEDEYELVDTGVFEESRYFDVELTYAKSAPDDICILIEARNRGPEAAPLHILPTVWFRNTWSWGRDNRRAQLRAVAHNVIETTHGSLGTRWLVCDDRPQLLFCENETNSQRLWGTPNTTPFPKDGINDHVISGTESVNPAQFGTKGSAWYRSRCPPARRSASVCGSRTSVPRAKASALTSTTVMHARRDEADEFFDDLADVPAGSPLRDVQRRAIAGLLWAKKHFRYDVREWLEGDPAMPSPPARSGERTQPRVGAPLQRRHHLDARRVGVPVVRRVGPRVPHAADGDRGSRLREGAAAAVLPRVVHAPERTAPRVRVGVQRCEPARARVGGVARATRSTARAPARRTLSSSSGSSTSCSSTSAGG